MDSEEIYAIVKDITTSGDTVDLVRSFALLSNALDTQYGRTRTVSGVDEVVDAMKSAVELVPHGDARLPVLLTQLGVCQRIRFSTLSNHLPDIIDSISNTRTALGIAETNGSGEVPDILHSLSLSLWRAYDFTRRLSYLEEAIELGKRSVDLTHDDHPSIHTHVYDLGRLLDARLTACQIFADGEQATSLILRGVNLAGEKGDPYLVADMIDTLGFAMLNKYSTRLERADLSEAIFVFEMALEVAPDDHPNLAGILHNFGRVKTLSFYTDEDPAKLEDALSTLRQSVTLTKEGCYDLPRRLHGLGVALRIKFRDTQSLEVIQEAIACFNKAFHLEPRGSEKVGMRVLEVVEAMSLRCGITGEALDVDWAIDAVKGDIQVMEGREQGEFVQVLEDLARTFVQRFKINRNPEDIDQAITVLERAMHSIAPESHLIPSLLNNLGNTYEERYVFSSCLPSLDAAIVLRRKVVAATPHEHSKLPWYLISLSISLLKRYQAASDLKDVEEAIRIQKEVIEKVSIHHGMLGCWYMEQAHSFLAIHGKTGSWDALKTALALMGKSFSFVRDTGLVDVPGRSTALGMMSTVMQSTQEEVRKAVGYYREAALAPYGNTPSRLQAAQRWAEHARTFDVRLSLEGYGRAIDLISEFVGLEQTQTRRHQNIAQISNLSRAAAATALDAGEVGKALNWLERGRCLVWSQLNSLRTPVDELRLEDPDLAERLEAVSKALEATNGRYESAIGCTPDEHSQGSASSSVDLTIQWKEILARVRQMPGFEDFLAARSLDMRELPLSGTVVVVNIHETRCDALALRATWSDPMHVPLPRLSHGKAAKMVERLQNFQREAGVRTRGDGENEKETLADSERGLVRYKRRSDAGNPLGDLRELWNWVVHPILEAIGYMVPTEGALPRIWWCPTGPLASLPLHAAGTYDGNHATTRNFAISSYIPNVAALVNKMHPKKEAVLTGDPARVLIISQPATPGRSRLPGVHTEVAAIHEILKANALPSLHLCGRQATVSSVISKLPVHGSVHLACHASQHPHEPLKSGFALEDAKLELSDIIKENMHDAQLAFLSACQTSAGDENLSEEAMHLAAGMLAAGYKGVVATMWSIKDQYAPQVARDFYSELVRLNLEEGGHALGAGKAAEALHYAVAKLQSRVGRGEETLFVWAPYVHFGI